MATPPSAFTTPSIWNVRQQVVERLIAISCKYREGTFHCVITPESTAEHALETIYKHPDVPVGEKQYFAEIAFDLEQYAQWERNGGDAEGLRELHSEMFKHFRKIEKDLLSERTPDELAAEERRRKRKELRVSTDGAASPGPSTATPKQPMFFLPEESTDEEDLDADEEQAERLRFKPDTKHYTPRMAGSTPTEPDASIARQYEAARLFKRPEDLKTVGRDSDAEKGDTPDFDEGEIAGPS